MSLFVKNDGPRIVETNYWETEAARAGKLLVTCNDGAFRVLMPAGWELAIKEMESAGDCTITRGPLPSMGLRDAYEILFDDGSSNPFVIYLSPSSFDRTPAQTDVGRWYLLTVWTQVGGQPTLLFTRRCHYRLAEILPCLKAAPPAPLDAPRP